MALPKSMTKHVKREKPVYVEDTLEANLLSSKNAIIKKAVDLAKKGDRQMIRICWEQINIIEDRDRELFDFTELVIPAYDIVRDVEAYLEEEKNLRDGTDELLILNGEGFLIYRDDPEDFYVPERSYLERLHVSDYVTTMVNSTPVLHNNVKAHVSHYVDSYVTIEQARGLKALMDGKTRDKKAFTVKLNIEGYAKRVGEAFLLDLDNIHVKMKQHFEKVTTTHDGN